MLSRLAAAVLFVVALTGYVGILVVRQGPPATGDTAPLTAVTTALSHGDLDAAAHVVSLPNPPGYALLTAPLVALLRGAIGAPTWCTTNGRAEAAARGVPNADVRLFDATIARCGDRALRPDGSLGPPLPPWYRSQGLLGVLAWMVLVAGSWALLRASGAAQRSTEVALVVLLVIVPAASSAIVQLFHPQDLTSLGLAAGGLALVLRRRWLLAGIVLGAAFLTKQFAVLAFVPALAAVPDGRARARLVLPAAAVTGAGLLPFLAVAPRATLENLSGIGAGGAVAGATLVSILHASSTVQSAVARDFPVAFAVVVTVWARRRLRAPIAAAGPFLGLVLACLACRLVFESVIFPYYLLAASVAFLVLDLATRRLPDRALAWIAVTAVFVTVHPADRTVDALGTLGLAVVAVACGVLEVRSGAQLTPGGEMSLAAGGGSGTRP